VIASEHSERAIPPRKIQGTVVHGTALGEIATPSCGDLAMTLALGFSTVSAEMINTVEK